MKTKLVRIGNSRGVRLPKPFIDQAGLEEQVELVVREGEIVIAARADRSRRLGRSGGDARETWRGRIAWRGTAHRLR